MDFFEKEDILPSCHDLKAGSSSPQSSQYTSYAILVTDCNQTINGFLNKFQKLFSCKSEEGFVVVIIIAIIGVVIVIVIGDGGGGAQYDFEWVK